MNEVDLARIILDNFIPSESLQKERELFIREYRAIDIPDDRYLFIVEEVGYPIIEDIQRLFGGKAMVVKIVYADINPKTS